MTKFRDLRRGPVWLLAGNVVDLIWKVTRVERPRLDTAKAMGG
jgi:hypothetical protein